MGRRWIGIEMGEHAVTHCLPRLRKVVEGEQGGISEAVGWRGGGGFRFAALGAPLFDAAGDLHSDVRFADLAAFVWMRETGGAFDAAALQPGMPRLGVHEGTGCCLLFNGILGDKRPAGGNVLTGAVLGALHASCPHDGPKVVYGEACRLGDPAGGRAHRVQAAAACRAALKLRPLARQRSRFMPPTLEDLAEQAERLSVADRELLIERLRQSIGAAQIDPEIDAAWRQEVERRLDAVDRGEMQSIPWEEAKKRLGL